MTDPAQPTSEADLFTPSASRLATLFYAISTSWAGSSRWRSTSCRADYRTLLAHHDHMTVALESFHQSPVSVEALAEWRDEASYARTSLLSRQSDGAIVQFGIMRIWLADLPADAQEEITEQAAPLGRVLIEHNVLREVELITLWKITPGPVLQQHLGSERQNANLRPLGTNPGRRTADGAAAGNRETAR